MKSIRIHAAKDLRVEDLEMPEVGNGQMLIRLAVGGICGSDLHYYNNGGFGPIKLKQPMTLGHEVCGHVEKLGEGAVGFEEGDLVAVSPSRPCYDCNYCHQGLHMHCLSMRFYGSAMPFPHIQGAFSEVLVAETSQCVNANGLTASEAAMAEPFAVTLHAINRAGSMLGKKVLVTGAGPIGLLSIIAARRAGASKIVAVDLTDVALKHALDVGADEVYNTKRNPESLDHYQANKGYFDVLFECSGAVQALTAGISCTRPRGVLMQLGLGGDMSLPMMAITAKELELRGSFRFHDEFALAIDLMKNGLVDLKPLVTHKFHMTSAVEAFELANDKSQAMKVHIEFTG